MMVAVASTLEFTLPLASPRLDFENPLHPFETFWLHGHVHDSVDYGVGRCRLVANPAGYATSRSTVAGGARLELENELFDPRLVIDVPV